jgi:alpha-maltose-1-phosphate synthase
VLSVPVSKLIQLIRKRLDLTFQMLILSHPSGNEFVREAARAFNENGLLAEFWTSVCWDPENPVNKLLPSSITRELNRRAFAHVRQDQLHLFPWRESGRILASRLGLSRLMRHEVGVFSLDAVYQSFDSKVATRLGRARNIEGVYAYEDGALATFREAKRLGIKTIYELPIGYWRAYRELIEEEAELQPEWAATLQGSQDSAEKLRRKDEELVLATHIIVPSRYVKQTLSKAGPLDAEVTVLPYGAPAVCGQKERTLARSDKLRVIFVGSLTQRKGISYLLEAVGRLGSRVELTLIGLKVGECKALDRALRMLRWIPSLPHTELLEEIRRHDVMIFPSLFEGFGLVILEAMANGLPVITTLHTGAPDFLSDGHDGFIVPIRDAEAIAEKLEMLLRDRERLAAMSQAAMRKAALQSWKYYRRSLVNTVQQALAEPVDAHLSVS